MGLAYIINIKNTEKKIKNSHQKSKNRNQILRIENKK